ncbi:uncharacterized protein [Henckelia pumila]|uniref:uncharacterized protein n=1 Tax=Henckelia pumila TaxID=405737 RepID=UPI003C6E92DE
MASETREGNPPSSFKSSSKPPNTLHDLSLLSITTHKLTDHNYLQWSSSVLMFIRGKGKENHLFPDITPSEQDASKLKAWKADDSMIVPWLINSMTPEISENCLLFRTAYEIWEAVRETFSCKDNTAELFEIKELFHDLRQGESTVTAYFTNLSRYWQKVDLLESHTWKCSTDGENYRKIIETKRVFKLLFGLNKSLDEVRGQVLSTKPLPSVREMLSEVRREEIRRKVMLIKMSPNTLDSSALASTQSPDSKSFRGRPWCEHCRRPGHTKETCWKLHGKPPNWKPRGNVAISPQFNSDQLNILHNLISQAQGTPAISHRINSGNIAQRDNLITDLHAQTSTPWIVDSSTSDHMTDNRSLFTSYAPSSRDIYVSIANGSRSRVIGIGSIQVAPQLTLKSVMTLIPGGRLAVLSFVRASTFFEPPVHHHHPYPQSVLRLALSLIV